MQLFVRAFSVGLFSLSVALATTGIAGATISVGGTLVEYDHGGLGFKQIAAVQTIVRNSPVRF